MTKLNALVGELEGLRRTTPNFHAVVFTQVCTTPLHQRLWAIQKGTRVLISLWDSLMFGRVPIYKRVLEYSSRYGIR